MLPKKGFRKITVNGFKYRWKASGDSYWIRLTIGAAEISGQVIYAAFDYHNEIQKIEDGQVKSKMVQQFVITPGIVRQVIEYTLKEYEWDPTIKGPEIHLGDMDEHVDLGLLHNI